MPAGRECRHRHRLSDVSSTWSHVRDVSRWLKIEPRGQTLFHARDPTRRHHATAAGIPDACNARKMNLGLEHQKVLVTGSTAGIGLATATAFARERAHVIVNGRNEERVRVAMGKHRERIEDRVGAHPSPEGVC